MPRKQKKFHFIYKTTNIINKKFYIGMHSTDDLEDGYIGSGKRLWNSIKKYGKENFVIERLEFFDEREELKNREKIIVNKDLLREPLCMNIMPGGEGAPIGNLNYLSNIGSKRSDETKKIMSSVQRGHRRNVGSKRSDETKKKMSENNKGSKNPFYNKHHSEIAKKKISEAGKGRRHLCSEETKLKISIIKKEFAKTPIAIMRAHENFRKQKLCLYCNKLFNTGNFAKYHDEKCKHKN